MQHFGSFQVYIVFGNNKNGQILYPQFFVSCLAQNSHSKCSKLMWTHTFTEVWLSFLVLKGFFQNHFDRTRTKHWMHSTRYILRSKFKKQQRREFPCFQGTRVPSLIRDLGSYIHSSQETAKIPIPQLDKDFYSFFCCFLFLIWTQKLRRRKHQGLIYSKLCDKVETAEDDRESRKTQGKQCICHEWKS